MEFGKVKLENGKIARPKRRRPARILKRRDLAATRLPSLLG